MFRLDLNDCYTWPVTVELPADGGKTAKAAFDARFRRLSQSEIEQLRARVASGEMTDAQLVREVLTGWSGIEDGNGEALPYSMTALDRLLDVYPLPACIVTAWLESLAGAKRKN